MCRQNNPIKPLSYSSHKGFTMLEVVIAMAVGAVGIMAFVALQLKSLEVSTQAYDRSTAVFLASEMAERMLSNAQDYGAQQVYLDEAGASWSQTLDENNYGVFLIPDTDFCFGLANNCSEEEMAKADILVMRQMSRALLPNGDMTLYKCGGGGVYQCISVAWEDANKNDCKLTMSGNGLDSCFVLQVKIW
jgi:type IV pilus assembly protein PilV